MKNYNRFVRLVFSLLILSFSMLWGQNVQGQNPGQQPLKVYDEGSSFYCGYACVRQGDHYLYIDSTGSVAFDTILNGQLSSLGRSYNSSSYEDPDSSPKLPDDYLLIAKKNKLGILTRQGKLLLSPLYDSIDLRTSNSWKLTKGGKQSVFTAKEGITLPFKFQQVWNMDGTYYNVAEDGKWGVYNRITDQLVIPCIYQDMDYCYGCSAKGDYVFAKKNGKWGIVDMHNKVLLPFEYEHQHRQMRSDEWVFCLLKEGKPRSINLKTGENRPMPPLTGTDDGIEQMADGYTRRQKEGKWGMFNSAGKMIYDYQYDFIRYDADEPDGYYLPAPFVALRKDNLCGVGDTTGKLIIAVDNSDWVFNIDSFFVARKGNREMLFNAKGKEVITGTYESIDQKALPLRPDSTVPKIILLKKGGKYGLYNGATGAFVAPKYDALVVGLQMSWMDRLYATTRMNTPDGSYKQGLLDIRTGQELFPPVYSSFNTALSDYENIVVCKDSLYGVFNLKAGRFTVPVNSGYISLLELPDLVKVEIDGHVGLTDPATGEQICPAVYDHIFPINQLRYLLVKDISDEKQQYTVLNTVDRSLHGLPYVVTAFNIEKALLVVSDSVTTKNTVRPHKAMLYDAVAFKVLEGAYSRDGFPEKIGKFYHDLAAFQKNGKYGFVDGKGQVIQPPVYDLASDFSTGKALVMQISKTGSTGDKYYKYGVLDTAGKLLLPVKYDYIQNSATEAYFSSDDFLSLYQLKDSPEELTDRLPVGNKGTTGKDYIVTGSIYRDVDLYYRGLAKKDGTVILPPVFDKVLLQQKGQYILAKKGKLLGVFDWGGKQLLSLRYADLLLEQPLTFDGKVAFEFPLLAKKAAATQRDKPAGQTNGQQGEPVLWQYLNKEGKPLSSQDIQVKVPMARLPSQFSGLF